MTPFPYAFRLAVNSLLREKWINLLSVLTIASGLLIISIALFSLYNIDAAARKLPEQFSIILYLDDNLPKDKLDHAVESLRKNSAVASVKYISKEDALKELKAGLRNSSYVLEGLDENPLPASLQLKLKKEAVGPETSKRVAEEALKIKGIKEADYGEKFVSTIHSLQAGMKAVGTILIIALSVGIIFVCYSTVKILFYRRIEEIETFKLLGATKGFIRAPFLIEGAVIGSAGGIVSLMGIFAFYSLVLLRLGALLPLFKTVLFPSGLFLSLPVIGLFLGMIGAAVALGRLRF
jgi:cell division transport system permease protein